MSVANSSSRRSPSLLDLPRELRDSIYNYTFDNLLFQNHPNSKKYTALTLTNRQLYAETKDLLFDKYFANLHFQFNNFYSLQKFVRKYYLNFPDFTGQIRVICEDDMHAPEAIERPDSIFIEKILIGFGTLLRDMLPPHGNDDDSDELFESLLANMGGNRMRDAHTVHGLQGEALTLGRGVFPRSNIALNDKEWTAELRYTKGLVGTIYSRCLQVDGDIGSFSTHVGLFNQDGTLRAHV